MKTLLPLLCIAALLSSCVSPSHVFRKEEKEIKAEREALRAAVEKTKEQYKRGEISRAQMEKEERIQSDLIDRHAERTVDYVQRRQAYTERYYEILEEEREANARAAAQKPQRSATDSYVFNPTSPSSPSSYTSSSSGHIRDSGSSSYSSGRGYSSTPRTTYSSDYRTSTSTTLGGNTRTSDRFGNSMTYSQNLDGSTRGTSNRGTVYQGSQTLGGGYKVTGSDGSSYTRQQNFDGSYKYKDNQGRTHTREQTLGGGYRYSTR